MTNYGDTSAWIRLTYGSDALYIKAEDWEYSISDPSAIVINYPNRGHFGFTLNTEAVMVTLKNVFVNTEAAWNILKAQLEAAEEAASCTLRIQVSSTTYELFNGVAGKDEMPVVISAKKGFKKVYKGDATFYVIGMITLKQVGDLA